MFKFVVISSILLSVVLVVQCLPNDLAIKIRCLKTQSACKVSKECCSGLCCDEKCTERTCRQANEICNNSTDICCSGQICRVSSKTCCHLANQTVTSPSECCVQPAKASGREFICPCSGHAQPCLKNEDCCLPSMQCSFAYPQFGPICL